MNRVLGIRESDVPGPLVILVGGLHGNEVTGVHAIINVFRSIEEKNIRFRGKIVGLLGNKKAFEKGVRYIDYDMNRCWDEGFVHNLKHFHNPNIEKAEDAEILELLGEIDKHREGTYTSKILVDLHATSSDNGNFIVIPEDEAENRIVKSLKLPIVVDLEKYLRGTLLEFLHGRQFVAFAFEGGLIGSDAALSMHTSGIWEILYAANMVEHRQEQEFENYNRLVDSFIHKMPHKVSVLYRHKVGSTDEFKMKSGFKNFQRVHKGELLAEDRQGEIRARENGLIFMPLYQALGDDGFFIVKELEGSI